MGFVFLSYEHQKDGKSAARLANAIERWNFDLYWDRDIEPGARYRQKIEDKIKKAECVVVLWSDNSVRSDWVLDEAELGKKTGTLLSVILDGSEPPLGFRQDQFVRLSGWRGGSSHKGLSPLRRALEDAAEPEEESVYPEDGESGLPVPGRGKPVTAEHMTLIHTSWRTPQHDDKWDEELYEFHVIVFGETVVLNRIDKVTWYLDPAYDEYGTSEFEVADRRKNFGFRELAWGDSLVKARIWIRNQRKPVWVSRFINLEEKGPRLKGEYF